MTLPSARPKLRAAAAPSPHVGADVLRVHADGRRASSAKFSRTRDARRAVTVRTVTDRRAETLSAGPDVEVAFVEEAVEAAFVEEVTA